MSDLLAAIYDPVIAPVDVLGVREWRRWAVGAARGRVLEVGVGTGLNLRYYQSADSIVAIDPAGASLQRAVKRKNKTRARVALVQARAEALPFVDESFDAVIGTLVFCTVAEPERALGQAQRVLRAGGAFRLIEHVRVHNRMLAAVQDALTPMWQHIAGGCHLNRDTLAMVRDARFRIRRVISHVGGLFIGIDAIR